MTITGTTKPKTNKNMMYVVVLSVCSSQLTEQLQLIRAEKKYVNFKKLFGITNLMRQKLIKCVEGCAIICFFSCKYFMFALNNCSAT